MAEDLFIAVAKIKKYIKNVFRIAKFFLAADKLSNLFCIISKQI